MSKKKGRALGERGFGAGDGRRLIVLELHERDGALVLHERAHQRRVGVKRVAADDAAYFAQEGAANR